MFVTERWSRSQSQCTGSQPSGDFKPSTKWQAAITFRQACSYLHSFTPGGANTVSTQLIAAY